MTQRNVPSIFVGDLWKAVHRLQPDAFTLARMLEILELYGDLRESPRQPVSRTVLRPPVTQDRSRAALEIDALLEDEDEDEDLAYEEVDAGEADDTTELGPGEEAAQDSGPRGRRILPIRIDKVKQPPSDLDFGFAPRTVPPATDEEHEPLPELLPLLDPGWTRAVATALMSVESPDGAVDGDTLVEKIARGELPAALPRLSEWTMRRGVQLLVDTGSGMVPFARDIDFLCASMIRLADPASVRVQRFRGGPWKELYDVARRERQPYELPPPGVPVVLITDFGIAREPFADDTAPPSEWAGFLDTLRAAGVPMVGLVPYPRQRWPRLITERTTLLTWDRATTVLQARTARRRSER